MISVVSATVLWWIVAVTVKSRAEVPYIESPTSTQEMVEQMWSNAIGLGGALGFPGLLVAGAWLAPRRAALAPLVGATVAGIHWTLGYTLLYALYWFVDQFLAYLAGFAFLAGGWTWIFPVQKVLRRR